MIKIFEIENWAECKYIQEHKCIENYNVNDFRILQTIKQQKEESKTWHFWNFRIATEDSVNEGEAEQVGDIIQSSMIVIYYCPFCGIKLE